MRLETTAGRLRDALEHTRRVVPATPRLAAYAGVLLSADDDAATVTGSDGDTQLQVTLAADVDEPGSALALPTPLLTLCRHITADASVAVTAGGDGQLEVAAEGLAPYTFATLPPTFPLLTFDDAAGRPVDAAVWPRVRAAVEACAPQDRMVRVHTAGDELVVSATDELRASWVPVTSAGEARFDVVVPLRFVTLAERFAASSLRVDAAGFVVADGDGAQVATRRAAVSYPDVGVLAPHRPAAGVVLPRGELLARLRRLRAVVDAGQPYVRVWLEDGAVVLAPGEGEVSGREHVAAVDTAGLLPSVEVSHSLLQSLVEALTGDVVQLAGHTAERPLYLWDERTPVVTLLVAAVASQ